MKHCGGDDVLVFDVLRRTSLGMPCQQANFDEIFLIFLCFRGFFEEDILMNGRCGGRKTRRYTSSFRYPFSNTFQISVHEFFFWIFVDFLADTFHTRRSSVDLCLFNFTGASNIGFFSPHTTPSLYSLYQFFFGFFKELVLVVRAMGPRHEILINWALYTKVAGFLLRIMNEYVPTIFEVAASLYDEGTRKSNTSGIVASPSGVDAIGIAEALPLLFKAELMTRSKALFGLLGKVCTVMPFI